MSKICRDTNLNCGGKRNEKRNRIKHIYIFTFDFRGYKYVFLPLAIPVHYNADLHVIKYGVKYMLLLVGVMVVVFGLFMKMIYKSSVNTNREKIVYRLSVIALLIFNGINLFALVNAFFKV